ncbi:MAG: tetratricopeptide repeat protein [Candidatus Methanomethylophilaceae archaeon]|nr:tetratricopeptide repeat protein [Candidatus Methanomethylophilaceae archaeon]
MTRAEGSLVSGDGLTQNGHITVYHGKLVVDVPRDLYRGPDAKVVEERAGPFIELVRTRYPWVTENSARTLIEKGRMEMMRVRDEESKGKVHARHLASQGKVDEAVEHLRIHLELDPGDVDSWYLLGELLCRRGDTEEGYRAINRARSLRSPNSALIASTTSGTVAPQGTLTQFPSMTCPFLTLQHLTMVLTSGSTWSAGQTLRKGTSLP